jgi:hypothetical protein
MITPPEMTHNEFHFYHDLIEPLTKFFLQFQILEKQLDSKENTTIRFPELYFMPPQKKPDEIQTKSFFSSLS